MGPSPSRKRRLSPPAVWSKTRDQGCLSLRTQRPARGVSGNADSRRKGRGSHWEFRYHRFLTDWSTIRTNLLHFYAGFNQVWFRYLLALSKESGVPIEGVADIENDIDDWHAQAEGKVKLPPKKADRFGWKTKVSDSLPTLQNHSLRHVHSIKIIPSSTDTVVRLVATHSKFLTGLARRGNHTPSTRRIH